MERGNRTIDEESLKRESSQRQLSLPFQPELQKSRDQETGISSQKVPPLFPGFVTEAHRLGA